MKRVWMSLGMVTLIWLVNFAGSSRPHVTFRVHVQTESRGLSSKQAFPVRLTHPDEAIMVNAIPEVSESDISDVESWPSDDEGLVLRVHFAPHGAQALSNATYQDQGKVMVVFLNGRLIYAPIIDMNISNGTLTIPRGVLPVEVAELETMLKKR